MPGMTGRSMQPAAKSAAGKCRRPLRRRLVQVAVRLPSRLHAERRGSSQTQRQPCLEAAMQQPRARARSTLLPGARCALTPQLSVARKVAARAVVCAARDCVAPQGEEGPRQAVGEGGGARHGGRRRRRRGGRRRGADATEGGAQGAVVVCLLPARRARRDSAAGGDVLEAKTLHSRLPDWGQAKLPPRHPAAVALTVQRRTPRRRRGLQPQTFPPSSPSPSPPSRRSTASRAPRGAHLSRRRWRPQKLSSTAR